MDVADHLAVINHGRLEQVGSPAELYDHPVNEFVLTFVGAATALGGRHVRPHDIAIFRHDSVEAPAPAGALRATVSRVVSLGFEVRVELELDGGATTYAQLDRAKARSLDLQPEDEVLVAAAEHIAEPAGATA